MSSRSTSAIGTLMRCQGCSTISAAWERWLWGSQGCCIASSNIWLCHPGCIGGCQGVSFGCATLAPGTGIRCQSCAAHLYRATRHACSRSGPQPIRSSPVAATRDSIRHLHQIPFEAKPAMFSNRLVWTPDLILLCYSRHSCRLLCDSLLFSLGVAAAAAAAADNNAR